MLKAVYSKVQTHKGSTRKFINVSLESGAPLGQLWTWPNTDSETHPWHAKSLNDDYRAFYAADGGLAAAKKFLEATIN